MSTGLEDFKKNWQVGMVPKAKTAAMAAGEENMRQYLTIVLAALAAMVFIVSEAKAEEDTYVVPNFGSCLVTSGAKKGGATINFEATSSRTGTTLVVEEGSTVTVTVACNLSEYKEVSSDAAFCKGGMTVLKEGSKAIPITDCTYTVQGDQKDVVLKSAMFRGDYTITHKVMGASPTAKDLDEVDGKAGKAVKVAEEADGKADEAVKIAEEADGKAEEAVSAVRTKPLFLFGDWSYQLNSPGEWRNRTSGLRAGFGGNIHRFSEKTSLFLEGVFGVEFGTKKVLNVPNLQPIGAKVEYTGYMVSPGIGISFKPAFWVDLIADAGIGLYVQQDGSKVMSQDLNGQVILSAPNSQFSPAFWVGGKAAFLIEGSIGIEVGLGVQQYAWYNNTRAGTVYNQSGNTAVFAPPVQGSNNDGFNTVINSYLGIRGEF